jgi:hypothetical protein
LQDINRLSPDISSNEPADNSLLIEVQEDLSVAPSRESRENVKLPPKLKTQQIAHKPDGDFVPQELTLDEFQALPFSTKPANKEPKTSQHSTSQLGGLSKSDDLLYENEQNVMGLQNVVANSQVEDSVRASNHSSVSGRPSPTLSGNQPLLSPQNARAVTTHTLGPIGHHPNDIRQIQRLEQKLAAYETAKYLGEINMGPGARPKRQQSSGLNNSRSRSAQSETYHSTNTGGNVTSKTYSFNGNSQQARESGKRNVGVTEVNKHNNSKNKMDMRNQSSGKYYSSNSNTDFRDGYRNKSGYNYDQQWESPKRTNKWNSQSENERPSFYNEYGSMHLPEQPKYHEMDQANPQVRHHQTDHSYPNHTYHHIDRPKRDDQGNEGNECTPQYTDGYQSYDTRERHHSPPNPTNDYDRGYGPPPVPRLNQAPVLPPGPPVSHNQSIQNNGYQSHASTSQNSIRSAGHEPKHRMPEFDGRVEWKAFWLQFTTLAEYYTWDEENQLRKLMFSLKGQALDYVAQLPELTRLRLSSLTYALDKRFGDHILPETYRATLNNVKKQFKESNREYEARVRKLVTKAYPGLEGNEMYNSLTVEHLGMGLPDPNMAFDILARKPKTVEEALHAIEWYECCKATQKKRHQVRKVTATDERDSEPEENTAEIRRFGGKKFVTEERLYQFGNELQSKLVSALTEVVGKEKSVEVSSEVRRKEKSSADQSGLIKGKSWESSPKYNTGSITCYRCGELGHYARSCPKESANVREIAENDGEWTEYSEEDEYESEN